MEWRKKRAMEKEREGKEGRQRGKEGRMRRGRETGVG